MKKIQRDTRRETRDTTESDCILFASRVSRPASRVSSALSRVSRLASRVSTLTHHSSPFTHHCFDYHPR
jgi:hypothetical protein